MAIGRWTAGKKKSDVQMCKCDFVLIAGLATINIHELYPQNTEQRGLQPFDPDIS